MIDIMANVQHYVPVLSREREVALESGEYVTLNEQCIHSILFGGDQLTAARAQGSQLIHSNSEIPSERLEGLHPVAEDWHTKVTVLKVHIIQITQSQL